MLNWLVYARDVNDGFWSLFVKLSMSRSHIAASLYMTVTLNVKESLIVGCVLNFLYALTCQKEIVAKFNSSFTRFFVRL